MLRPRNFRNAAMFRTLKKSLHRHAQSTVTFISNASAHPYGGVVFVGMGTMSMLANVSYAGMRAQDKPELESWRMVAFIWGFPYTIVTWFFVFPGSKKAYGVDLPTNDLPANGIIV